MVEIIESADGQVTEEIPKEPMKGKNGSKKIIWILLFIFFFLLAGVVYFYIKSNENVTPQNVEEKETIEEEPKVEDNSNVTSSKVEEKETVEEEQRIEEIKENLVALIPDKYEVVEKNYEALSSESDSCIFLYEIYPKEYSDIEKEYLNKAFLIYCKDINTAILDNQVGEVRYSNEEDRWLFVYGETITPQEEKQYGENLVTITELGGSHASSNYYIVRIDGSDELVILSVPSFHRIRCETYDENGVETMKKDCIEFITSMGMPADCSESVPDEVYENYYNDLLEILKDL